MVHMFKPAPYPRLLHGIEYGVVPVLKRARAAFTRMRGGGGAP